MKQVLSLKIEKLSMGGFGIGHFANKAIFVPYCAPGDVIDGNVTHERKDHAFAQVCNVISRGEAFRNPPCKAFGTKNPCGGCDWLMLDYSRQLQYKHELIKELFQSFVKPELIHPTIASVLQTNYRNKVFMPVGRDAQKGKINYGIYSRWTHSIVPHESCENHPQVFDALAKRIMQICEKANILPYDEARHKGNLRHIGFRANRDGSQILVILVTLSGKLPFGGLLVKQLTAEFSNVVGIVQNINRSRGNVILGTEQKLLYGQDFLCDTLGGLSFRINYRSFWQINSGTMENILDSIRSQIDKKDSILDAYSGIGAIGLCLANEAAAVTLVEEIPEAIADAEVNAEQNGITNVRFVNGRCEEILPNLLSELQPDVLIADPPRSGIDAESLQAILHSKIDKIIYLSCAPMTLARDLKLLMAEGNYELSSLQSFDMFPNTWHIECLAVLKRKSPKKLHE